jgi:TM2 domain-containing membrane protein YozV
MSWYNHPKDTRNLIIGVVASLFGVIVWEIIKEKKLWNNNTIKEDIDTL